MTRLSLLLPLLALAACAGADRGFPLGGRAGLPEPAPPEPLPPRVLAALPAGVPPSVVTRNADGCYLITLERTDPPTGFPLTDAAGDRICDLPPAADLDAAPSPA